MRGMFVSVEPLVAAQVTLEPREKVAEMHAWYLLGSPPLVQVMLAVGLGVGLGGLLLLGLLCALCMLWKSLRNAESRYGKLSRNLSNGD